MKNVVVYCIMDSCKFLFKRIGNWLLLSVIFFLTQDLFIVGIKIYLNV